MEEAGPSDYLFNGTSMFGWTTVDGEWTVPPGDAVIEGSDGELQHALPRLADSGTSPVQLFRLVVVVEPKSAESVNVQFGFDAAAASADSSSAEGPRYVVQLTPQQVLLGECDGGAAPTRPLPPPRDMPIAADEQHAVVLERLPTGWFVTVDDTPIGALPLRPRELPQFRLGAGPGAARFSDIEIVPLRPKP